MDATQMTLQELREKLERDELSGEDLIVAHMRLYGYDRDTAEMIVSGDHLPEQDGDITTLS